MKKRLSGSWLIDSNIIVYALDTQSSFYQDACGVFQRIKDKEFTPVVAVQNITEVIHVLHRSYKVNLQEAAETIEGVITGFDIHVITPQISTAQTFFGLLDKHSDAKSVYDTFLVATMVDNGYTSILTVNIKDFSFFSQITSVNPFIT